MPWWVVVASLAVCAIMCALLLAGRHDTEDDNEFASFKRTTYGVISFFVLLTVVGYAAWAPFAYQSPNPRPGGAFTAAVPASQIPTWHEKTGTVVESGHLYSAGRSRIAPMYALTDKGDKVKTRGAVPNGTQMTYSCPPPKTYGDLCAQSNWIVIVEIIYDWHWLPYYLGGIGILVILVYRARRVSKAT